MKKIFTKLFALAAVMLVGSSSAWADDVTLGITRTIASSESTTDKTTSGAAVTGKAVSGDIIVDNCDDVTVALAYKVESDMTDKARNTYWYNGSSIKCYVDKGVHNYRNSTTTLGDNNYFAFTLTIAEGKALSIKSITGDIMMDGDKTSYQMAIVDKNGTEVYTSQTKACNKSGSALKSVPVSDLAENIQAALTNMTGVVTVKLRWTNTANTGKYCVIKDFNVVAEVSDAAAQTQYNKPTIKAGDYDKVNGTYAVTLTANDDDAVVNYTIGTGDKVTGVESGTIINVAPNTTVTATVSGSAYTESDTQSLTTSAAPKTDKPTYSVGSYDYAANTYSVTLEGTGVMYKIGEGAWTEYTEVLNVPVKTQVQAKGAETNMSESDVISFTTNAAPTGGTFSTPTTAGTYSDAMTYNAGAFTIPSTNSYIGAQISSGNSSINGAIKMRISRDADPNGSQAGKYGFHILVNPGNTLSSVSLQMLNNYDTQIALTGVYVDNGTDNLLDAPVALEYASAKTVAAAVATVSGISATEKVVFVFEKTAGETNPNQAQIIISANAVPSVNLNMNLNASGFSTFSCAAPVKISGAKAYKATLNGDELTCTEIEGGLVPAGEGVILCGEAGAEVTASYNVAPAIENNDLKATTLADGSLAEFESCLVLSGKTFMRYEGSEFAANKAYFSYSAPVAAPFRIVIEDNDVTGINNVVNVNTVAPAKRLVNGQIVIEKNGVKYNAAGAQMK